MRQLCISDLYQHIPYRWPIRLYMGLLRIHHSEALNCDVRTGTYSAVNFHQKFVQLKNQGINLVTGQVDYSRLADSAVFRAYVDATHSLQNLELDNLETDSQRKAFWINVYNALIIHGVIAYGVSNTIQEIRGAFDRIAYVIGGYRFSADDIEHGILRANRGHIIMPGTRFGRDDPRSNFVITQFDPRIHFALVCASESCPPINIYDADNIDNQLELATRNFINSDEVVVDRANMTVLLSRIFQWYSSDFDGGWMGLGSKVPVLRFIAEYLVDASIAQFIRQNVDRLSVRYQNYDRSLNV